MNSETDLLWGDFQNLFCPMILCLDGEVVRSNLDQYILLPTDLRSRSHFLSPQALAGARSFLSPRRPLLYLPDLRLISSRLAVIHGPLAQPHIMNSGGLFITVRGAYSLLTEP